MRSIGGDLLANIIVKTQKAFVIEMCSRQSYLPFAWDWAARLGALDLREIPNRLVALSTDAEDVFNLVAIWSILRFARASCISARSFFMDQPFIRVAPSFEDGPVLLRDARC
jgi:hypothetical protein